jgi:hypothetical protein
MGVDEGRWGGGEEERKRGRQRASLDVATKV